MCDVKKSWESWLISVPTAEVVQNMAYFWHRFLLLFFLNVFPQGMPLFKSKFILVSKIKDTCWENHPHPYPPPSASNLFGSPQWWGREGTVALGEKWIHDLSAHKPASPPEGGHSNIPSLMQSHQEAASGASGWAVDPSTPLCTQPWDTLFSLQTPTAGHLPLRPGES